MKKIRNVVLVLLSVSVLALALSGCGGSAEEAEQEARQAFDSVMNAFVAGDVEKIKTYCDSSAINQESELRSIILSSLGNVTYTVNSAEAQNSKKVTVNADINLIDASQVMQKYIESIAAMISSDEYQSKLPTMTKEEYQEMMDGKLAEILSSGEMPSVTKNLSVIMVKSGDGWKVEGSELPDLLVTNTLNAINQIKQ